MDNQRDKQREEMIQIIRERWGEAHPVDKLLDEIERLESIQKLWRELNPTVYAMYGMIANLEVEVSQLREERDQLKRIIDIALVGYEGSLGIGE